MAGKDTTWHMDSAGLVGLAVVRPGVGGQGTGLDGQAKAKHEARAGLQSNARASLDKEDSRT